MAASVRDRTYRRWLLGGVAVVALAVLATALSPLALRATGRLLVGNEAVERVDLAIMTVDSGLAGLIELGDLFHEHLADRVGMFAPPETAADRELERRGVHPPDQARDILVELGVTSDRIVSIASGEVGTTESAAAVYEWCRTHRVGRVLIVVSATHGRRFRRTIRRAWHDGTPIPIVRVPRFDAFDPDEWWRSRSTLREGIVEAEKLLWDVVSHPFELLR